MKNIAYIGIGSNVGEKLTNIALSIELIDKNIDCKVEVISSIYESTPYGDVEQNNFMNAVIKIITSLEPIDLFHFLKLIEMKVGRKVTEKWGPREIDLDILLFNDLIYSDEEITIPHKDMLNRDFVLVPLIEIEPNLKHPNVGKKLSEICIFEPESEHSSAPNIKNNIIRKIPHKVLIS